MARKKALVRGIASILSPLRYPGAKRRLAGYVAEVLRLSGLRPKLFVEPFAGGASVALALLNDGLVEKIALGERDPLVAAFWKTAFWDSEWLIEKLERIPVTVEKWRELRCGRFQTVRDRALACLFLNRTSFSGILSDSAGPIGGYDQKSPYKIDCRFTAATIVRRIRQVSALAKKVKFVRCGNWQKTIELASSLGYKPGEVFIYLDPPFFKQADRLYRYYFRQTDHQALRDATRNLRHPWLLSYDAATEILDLYADHHTMPEKIDLLYSVRQASVQVQEIIITNLPNLPSETRLWRSSDEWRRSRPAGGKSQPVNTIAEAVS